MSFDIDIGIKPLTRTLSMPTTLGSNEVVTTTMVLMRAPSSSWKMAVKPTTPSASVQLFPSLDSSDFVLYYVYGNRVNIDRDD